MLSANVKEARLRIVTGFDLEVAKIIADVVPPLHSTLIVRPII
jgi:hypothetical protein